MSIRRPVFVSLVTICFLSVVLTGSSRAQKRSPDAVIATVNGTTISEGDLAFLYSIRGVREELRPQIRQRYIDELIDRALLKQFLESRRVKADEKIVDERLRRVEKLITIESLDFDETLKSFGYSRETFRQAIALPLAWRTHARLAITRTSIRKYWETHRNRFDGTEVRAAHIVKRIPDKAAKDQIEKTVTELTELKARIEAGELSFADAAMKHSDSPSAKDGGSLGQFKFRGRMPTDLTKIAFGLKTGAISPPQQTRFGIHLMTVTQVIEGDLSLEDARVEIFDALSNALKSRLIEMKRKEAKIERVGS